MRYPNKGTVRNTAEGMARGTDFTVNLETAAETASMLGMPNLSQRIALRLMIEGLGPFIVNPRIFYRM
jgi:hypothetical protein